MMVQDLDEQMGAQEFQRWMAYYNIEPFGAIRDNWHMARLGSLYASVHTPRGRPSMTSDDFMFKDPATTQRDHIKTMMARFNAVSTPKDSH